MVSGCLGVVRNLVTADKLAFGLVVDEAGVVRLFFERLLLLFYVLFVCHCYSFAGAKVVKKHENTDIVGRYCTKNTVGKQPLSEDGG